LVRIDTVLESYGYQVRADTDREQQFSCDLHGDGTDSKPSARCYPSTNQFYCFACSQSRDAIQLVREKENLSFLGAIEHLEKKYGLPSLPWEEGDREEKPTDEVAAILDAPYADPVRVRAERVIRALTTERADSLSRVLKMWEAFDRARLLEEGGDPEPMRSLLKVVLHHSVT
jgi:hypothetical protein